MGKGVTSLPCCFFFLLFLNRKQPSLLNSPFISNKYLFVTFFDVTATDSHNENNMVHVSRISLIIISEIRNYCYFIKGEQDAVILLSIPDMYLYS